MAYLLGAIGVVLCVLIVMLVVQRRRERIDLNGFRHEDLKRLLERHEKEHPDG